MSDREPDQSGDDFEVEITDIDEVDHRGGSVAPSAVPLRVSLRSQLSFQQRLLRLTITSGLVVLVLLVMGSGSIHDTLVGLFGRPLLTPTPTLEPGSDLFEIDASPSWGKLFIDGHSFSLRPATSSSSHGPPYRNLIIQLTRGRHQFVWQADPFQPQRCFMSVPVSASDTCHYTLESSVDYPPDTSGLASWRIIFSESLAVLPNTQRVALMQAAQEALDAQQSTETVQPGEHYIHTTAIDTTTQPLHATLHFQLDTNYSSDGSCILLGQSCTSQGQYNQDCRSFCTLPEQYQPPSFPMRAWNVVAMVHPFWDYATLDDRVVVQDQLDILPNGMRITSFVPLSIVWDGGENGRWHVTMIGTGLPLGNNLACASAETEVKMVLAPALESSGWQFVPGSIPAIGCLAIAEQSGVIATPSSSSSVGAYCLYRFGVLLAANDAAHRFWPHMPLANTYERRLAQQLATMS